MVGVLGVWCVVGGGWLIGERAGGRTGARARARVCVCGGRAGRRAGVMPSYV